MGEVHGGSIRQIAELAADEGQASVFDDSQVRAWCWGEAEGAGGFTAGGVAGGGDGHIGSLVKGGHQALCIQRGDAEGEAGNKQPGDPKTKARCRKPASRSGRALGVRKRQMRSS